ncbi:MAG TPA: hypothetical protein VFQ85_16050 [Mycobacteriales bacterium]|jgi:hypothetical protein|nr:hypothetical protein [Mycobacteriales bacterium]
MPRSALAALALAATAAVAPPPAHAAGGAVVLVGTFQYRAAHDYEPVTGQLVAAGAVNGVVAVDGTAWERAGLCPAVASTISGTFSGAFDATFYWTRVGAVALVTTRGDVDSDGVAVAAFTAPPNPCFEDATLTVAITLPV